MVGFSGILDTDTKEDHKMMKDGKKISVGLGVN